MRMGGATRPSSKKSDRGPLGASLPRVPDDVLRVGLVAVEHHELAERLPHLLAVAEHGVISSGPCATGCSESVPQLPRVFGVAVVDVAEHDPAQDQRKPAPAIWLDVLVRLQAALGEVEAPPEERAAGGAGLIHVEA